MAGTEAITERLSHVAGRISRISGQLDALRDQLDESRADFEDDSSQAPLAAPPAPGQLELEYVNETLRKLLYGESQEEILDIFLEEAQSFVQRAILFLQRDGRYVTWKSYGFDPESIRDIALEDSSDAIVRSARQRQLIYRRDHPTDSMPWLARTGNLPRATFCIPLVFENSVPVVFYGDSSDSIAIDSLELLTHLTVLVLKNNYLQQLAAGAQPVVLEAPAAPDAVEDAPVEEAVEEEVPVDEAVEAAPVEDVPVEEVPVQEAPVEEDTVEEAVVEEAADEEPPAEDETGWEMLSDLPSDVLDQAAAEEEPGEDEAQLEGEAVFEEAPPEADWDDSEPSFEEASPESEEDAANLDAAPLEAEEAEAEAASDTEFPPVEEAQEADEESVDASSEADDFDFELPEEQEVKFEIDLDSTPEVEEVLAEAAEEAGGQSAQEVAEEAAQEALESDTTALEEAPEDVRDVEDEAEVAGWEEEPSPEAASPEEDFLVAPESDTDFAPQAEEPEDEPSAEGLEASEEPSFDVPPEPQFEPPQPEFGPEAQEEAPAEPERVSSLSSEEEKKVHDDARRFARLLVSEIKLYNEEQVENGRLNADLYDRLTRDVDRSRDMYNKRVHPEVAQTVDYFHEELVRILAKGDESLLGDSYPGPQR